MRFNWKIQQYTITSKFSSCGGSVAAFWRCRFSSYLRDLLESSRIKLGICCFSIKQLRLCSFLSVCLPMGKIASCSIKSAAVLIFQHAVCGLSKSQKWASVHSCKGGYCTRGVKHCIISEPDFSYKEKACTSVACLNVFCIRKFWFWRKVMPYGYYCY